MSTILARSISVKSAKHYFITSQNLVLSKHCIDADQYTVNDSTLKLKMIYSISTSTQTTGERRIFKKGCLGLLGAFKVIVRNFTMEPNLM